MTLQTPLEPGDHRPGPESTQSAGRHDQRGRAPIVLVLATLVGAVALVAAVVLLTRGNSTDKKVPLGGPPTSSSPAPSPTRVVADPQAAMKAEVIAAYRASWEDQLAVGRDPTATADDDRLRAHRTGESLVSIQGALLKFKAANRIYVGEVKLNPTVVELGVDKASIRDCVDDATGAADAKTGQIVEPATRVIKTATVTMQRVGGMWKQANYRSDENPCTPAGS